MPHHLIHNRSGMHPNGRHWAWVHMDVFIQPNHITSFAEPRNLFGQRIGHLSLKDLWPENETLLNSHPPKKMSDSSDLSNSLGKKNYLRTLTCTFWVSLNALNSPRRTSLTWWTLCVLTSCCRCAKTCPVQLHYGWSRNGISRYGWSKKSLRYQFFTVEPPEVVST